MNFTDKTCLHTEYRTPEYILDVVRSFFGGVIELDPATSPDNPTKARKFFTKETDGLSQDWSKTGVFVNPPYGKELRKWVAKIGEEARKGHEIVALLPGQRFETRYWQRDILIPQLGAIVFIRGRVSFLDSDGIPRKSNPFGSMLYLFNLDTDLELFATLGQVLVVDHFLLEGET